MQNDTILMYVFLHVSRRCNTKVGFGRFEAVSVILAYALVCVSVHVYCCCVFVCAFACVYSCVCVCVCVCERERDAFTHICTHASHIRIHLQLNVQAVTHTRTNAHTHTHKHKHTYIHTHTHMCMFLRTFVYMSCVYMSTFLISHTHTFLYSHTHSGANRPAFQVYDGSAANDKVVALTFFTVAHEHLSDDDLARACVAQLGCVKYFRSIHVKCVISIRV